MRTITVPAGIGDFIWLAMKLINTGEKFKIRLPDGSPQRGHQILQLLPQLVESHEYTPRLSYRKLADNNIQNTKKNWDEIGEKEFYLSANSHLESGYRLEEFLPDLLISYRLKYDTKAEDKIYAKTLLPDGPKYIAIYTSAYGTTRNWGFWDENQWLILIMLIWEKRQDVSFVIIGAEWDVDLSSKLMALIKQSGIPFVNTVGRPLSTVIEIMKRLTYGFYFPSGLPILNETLGGAGSVMFYPPFLKPMINSWAEPERIKNGTIKECLFCKPKQIFDWCTQNGKI
jgi:hypothetical protein